MCFYFSQLWSDSQATSEQVLTNSVKKFKMLLDKLGGGKQRLLLTVWYTAKNELNTLIFLFLLLLF